MEGKRVEEDAKTRGEVSQPSDYLYLRTLSAKSPWSCYPTGGV